ncbi:MAG: hypothetical protein V7681_15005 [Halopseudomonas sabulinigri]
MSEHDEEHVVNQSEKSLTYTPWAAHLKEFFYSQKKTLLLLFLSLFSIFIGLLEAAKFFYPNSKLNSAYILGFILCASAIISIIHCIGKYKNTVLEGLEKESKIAQKIAFSKRPFWEYGLAFELLSKRLNHIDRDLDDVLKNRVHVKIVRTPTPSEYMDWVQTRPKNLIRLVSISKQLLIFDLIEAMHADNNDDSYFRNLVHITDLIMAAYRSTYQYEVEGREVLIPENFEILHEIQSGWASVIREGISQMLNILDSVARRKNNDLSAVNETIVFEEPPGIENFCEELDKISGAMRTQTNFKP